MAKNICLTGKKLLIFTPYFHPHLGGVEKHVLKTSQLLKEQGWQLDILTQQHESDLFSKEQVRGLSVHRFSFPQVKLFGLLVIWWRIMSRYWGLIARADVIHVHDVMLWLLPVRILFPRKNIVLTMHGWEGIYPIPKKNIWLKRLSATLASQVICVGEYIGLHYGVRCDAVIYGGIDPASVLSKKEMRQKWQLAAAEKIRLVYLGRLAEDTGLKLLLAAWEQLPEQIRNRYELVFVGDGKLRQECEWAGKVLGWVHAEQIQSELRSAHICFASGYLSALEGLAAGCRVWVGAQHELRQDYWQLSQLKQYVELIKQPAQIMAFLEQLQPPNQAKQSLTGRPFILIQSWQQISQLYLQLYSSTN